VGDLFAVSSLLRVAALLGGEAALTAVIIAFSASCLAQAMAGLEAGLARWVEEQGVEDE
jgi:hypothetical protein